MADIALIGGSLLPFGGQNLIEAAACGTPIIVGPHTYNFAAAADTAILMGAAQRLSDIDAAAIAEAVERLIGNPTLRDEAANATATFVQKATGATTRTLTLIHQQVVQS